MIDKSKFAKKFGADIAKAESVETLNRLFDEVDEAYNHGNLFSHDKQNLDHYIEHRTIVMKHEKPSQAKILESRLEDIKYFNDIKGFVKELIEAYDGNQITNDEYNHLHSGLCHVAGVNVVLTRIDANELETKTTEVQYE